LSEEKIALLRKIKDFNGLVDYLKSQLNWPIDIEDADDISFDYNPEDLGIDVNYAAKIQNIKQIRPLADNQPWGVFYIEFESKDLPVVILRRILNNLVGSRRNAPDRLKTWDLGDLIFISSTGEKKERKITFAHFSESDTGTHELKTFSWEKNDTFLHYLQNKLDLDKLQWPEDPRDIDTWRDQWSMAFRLGFKYVIRTSKQLATEMAHISSQIRNQVKIVYAFEVEIGPLHNLVNNFKEILVHDLEIDAFADMYAQTITYGLFSARASREGDFTLKNIVALIPNTNPFLKGLFEECTRIDKESSKSLDLEELGIIELINLLRESNIEAILQDFGKQKKGEDPVIHFYESFLTEYDKEQKVKRGVFYTPDPVVSFIIRSINKILKNEFNLENGLANNSQIEITQDDSKIQIPLVQILDPATGTGTFLKHVIEIIKKEFDQASSSTGAQRETEWNAFVSSQLFSRFYGFELMMAPYAVAHLKLGLALSATGYQFQEDKRLGIYLTNTLEGVSEDTSLYEKIFHWLSNEVKEANLIKNNLPICVIVGNPPYSVSSLNNSPFIRDLMIDYKKGLDETNMQPLNDDYIKFIRFAQWRISKTGRGVIGFISNNSFINNVIHRQMRKSILDSFDKIYILNLHGNSNIKEKCPDGSKDENVFDIRVGVSITFFIKTGNQKPTGAQVYLADLYGTREVKYDFLNENDIESVEYNLLSIREPNYFFFKRDFESEDIYNKFLSLDEIFNENNVGIKTHRDDYIIDFDKAPLVSRLEKLMSDMSDEEANESLGLNDDISRISKYRATLKENGIEDKYFKSFDYRIFDRRILYYFIPMITRARWDLMQHMLKDNIALVSTRLLRSNYYNHCFITDRIADIGFTSAKTSESAYFFPLYVYHKETMKGRQITLDGKTLLSDSGKQPNFQPKFVNFLKSLYHDDMEPEFVLNYIYAILHSKKYCEKYVEFLKTAFPRIPFTENYKKFQEIGEKGQELINVHLLRVRFSETEANFPVEGDNLVGKIAYDSSEKKIFINKNQFFDNISENIWNYCIGGYQVLNKWLKSRKNRNLSLEDVDTFNQIVAVLERTQSIITEIDEMLDFI